MGAELLGLAVEPETLALLMVVSLFGLLMLGYPVAFTLGGVALLFGFIGLDPVFFNLLPQRIWGVMGNFTLLAVPLFVFMGVMLERSGIAAELLEAMALLFGRLRSGLAISVVLAGALLAASTGIVGASVVTMGLISLPVMLKRGYRNEFATGVICSSGTLGQIIPPSIVLILLGDIMGVSVGELFIAAVIPGCILVGLYLAYSVAYCAIRKPVLTEPVDDGLRGFEVWIRVTRALVAPGVLVVAVLGSIFFGIASPTEAAAVGAFGSCVLAVLYRRLDLETLRAVMERTMLLTCMVFLILVGAQAFGLVFRGLSGDDAIRNLVLGSEHTPMGFLAIVMVLLFFLGCFLDFIEITFIVVPILVPLIEQFGFSKLWIAILIAMNLQMSFLTPPFGFSLFYLKGVAPEGVTSGQIYRGIIPFVILQAIALGLLIVFPEIVTYLPQLMDSLE